MYLILNYVEDNFARTIISDQDMKAGEVAMIEGLADNTLAIRAGVPVVGEAYKAVVNADSADDLFVLVAPDGHRYDQKDMWNKGELEDIVAGEAVRGYIVHKGMVVSVEETVLDGGAGLVVGDKLCAKVGERKLTKSAGTEDSIMGKVIERYELDGRKMVKILIVK